MMTLQMGSCQLKITKKVKQNYDGDNFEVMGILVMIMMMIIVIISMMVAKTVR
jgi:hypothetical protein